MIYRFCGEGETFTLPTAAADRALRLASRAQFKVLLWFARHTEDFDVAACAAAVGESEADCADALLFWQEMGVLTDGDAAVPPAAPAPSAPSPDLPPLDVTPMPKRPQLPDVVAKMRTSNKFRYLAKTAEERLGRAVSPIEQESLLYIYEGIGLPVEVILMLLVSIIPKGKAKSGSAFAHYLEKAAISWSEAGITTIDAAEAELCRQERREAVREHLKTLFSLERPSLLQVDAACCWIDQWHFSDEVLLVAYERCREKTGGFNANYVTRVLEGWLADGVTTPDQAREALLPKKKTAGKPLLSDEHAAPADTDTYERTAATYRPVYKKKKPKNKE